jgi:MerR family mercuric resistance operon transcriptional regulator
LLSLVDGGNYTCGEVHDMTLTHVADIRRTIADLRRMERVLKDMAAKCDGGDVPECPILEALSA